jgi:hypothetical protein
MADFRVAFAKDVHCTVCHLVLEVLYLRSFQVSPSILENLSYRLSVHAISLSRSIYLTRRRLESSAANKRHRLIAPYSMGEQKWPPYYDQALFSPVSALMAG